MNGYCKVKYIIKTIGYDLMIYHLSGLSERAKQQNHMTTWTAQRSIDFIDNFKHNEPLFLHISFFGPHQPWLPPGKWKDMYDPNDIKLPEQFYAPVDNNPVFENTKAQLRKRLNSQLRENDYKKLIAYYYGNVSMIDYYLGNIFQKLKEKNLWDNSVIIFTSDHGDHNGQYGLFFKSDMYDSSVKVPLIIKDTNSKPGDDRKSDAVINTLGLYGTILDYAGNRNWKNENIESISLYNIITDCDVEQKKNETYSIMCSGDKGGNTTMLRQKNHKLIRCIDGSDSIIYELYDMTMKPVETINIFGHPSVKNIQDDLVSKLDKWASQQSLKRNYITTDYMSN